MSGRRQERSSQDSGLLSGYTALDLTEGGYLICGKVLADMGARVIKIEPPGGSPSRNIGPFYKDICHPEKSLFWMAYNLGKLGVTLNLETPDGKRILSALAKRADFVLESFQPGYMKGLGLGYDDLSRVNPRTIMVSITPYGQDGPKAQYKSSDLMNWASSGVLYVTGSPDRPPVTVGYPPQATMQAGVEGATAALIAHWYREGTGEGQHVDVSAQAANIMLLQALVETWDIAKRDYKRAGTFWVAGTGLNRNQVFPCKDGYVAFTVLGGAIGPANSTRALVKWMEEDGMAPEEIRKTDWLKFDVVKLTQPEFDRIEEPFKKFLLTKTKRELWERSFRDGIILAPLNTMADITQFSHTQERGMWVKVPHPELGEELTYWGPFVRITGGPPISYRRRAPLIGEDNEAVYMGELGLSTEEMTLLKQAGTI